MGKESVTMKSKGAQYGQLPLDEDINPPEKRKTTLITQSLIHGILCALLMVIIITVISTTCLWPHKHPHLPQTIDCGNTTEEALSKGCIMEPMIYGWIPQECYFADLSAQYSPFEDRRWYTDATYSTVIAPADL
ncbi:hypothetical protein DID88_006178 [Monilinia fructigena]|uniref:Uncharacterized protein n=1 Tax=Monilinia fructigena TaxID=38457 RepID=A0A395J2Y5_9HELO|nr:hypothetical protein DID88_006178 [Monilinia fructigena]